MKTKDVEKKYTEAEEKTINNFRWELTNIVRTFNEYDTYSTYVVALYLIDLAGNYNLPSGVSIDNLVDDIPDSDVQHFVKENIPEETWKRIIDSAMRHNIFPHCREMICDSLDDTNDATPDAVCTLAEKLLDVKDGERVADICCGTGNFIKTVIETHPSCSIDGYEINTRSKIAAFIRSEVLGGDVKIKHGDAFSHLMNIIENNSSLYDKIFSNYPFGISLKFIHEGKNYLDSLACKIPAISKATSSDWVFNSVLVDSLSPSGKAIGIMTVGSAFNTIDKPVRKYFIEEGFIEAVISLPRNLFYRTNIPTIMVIMSHGNSEIKFVDAREICQTGRRFNTLSDEDIDHIVGLLHASSDVSKTISLDELRENDYVLNPERFFTNVVEFENGVPFEDIIVNITRGASITAKALDSISSEKPTDYQYLMLKNIHSGVIDEELPYITGIEKRYEKYCLKDNNLILSKNGYPYKVAVASIREGQNVLASGNMYVIELDEQKANPFYIKAFFESEQGINVLKSITVGATIPNIGVENLKKVKIPLPDMEEQRRIAAKYQATLDEIAILKIRMEKAQNKLMHILDEESEV